MTVEANEASEVGDAKKNLSKANFDLKKAELKNKIEDFKQKQLAAYEELQKEQESLVNMSAAHHRQFDEVLEVVGLIDEELEGQPEQRGETSGEAEPPAQSGPQAVGSSNPPPAESYGDPQTSNTKPERHLQGKPPTYSDIASLGVRAKCADLDRKLDRRPIRTFAIQTYDHESAHKFQQRVNKDMNAIKRALNELATCVLVSKEVIKAHGAKIDSMISGGIDSARSALDTVHVNRKIEDNKKEEELTSRQLRISDLPAPAVDVVEDDAVQEHFINSAILMLQEFDTDFSVEDIDNTDNKGLFLINTKRPKSAKHNKSADADKDKDTQEENQASLPPPPKQGPAILTLKDPAKAKTIDEACKKAHNAKVDQLGIDQAGRRKIQLCMTRLQRKAEGEAKAIVKEANQKLLDFLGLEDTNDLEKINIVCYPNGNPTPRLVHNKRFWDHVSRDYYRANKAMIDKRREVELKKKQQEIKTKRENAAAARKEAKRKKRKRYNDNRKQREHFDEAQAEAGAVMSDGADNEEEDDDKTDFFGFKEHEINNGLKEMNNGLNILFNQAPSDITQPTSEPTPTARPPTTATPAVAPPAAPSEPSIAPLQKPAKVPAKLGPIGNERSGGQDRGRLNTKAFKGGGAGNNPVPNTRKGQGQGRTPSPRVQPNREKKKENTNYRPFMKP